MERMSEEEFINNVERHITSLKNLDNKALKILVGKLEEENKTLKGENEALKGAMKELNNYNKFRTQENERLKKELKQREKGEYKYMGD